MLIGFNKPFGVLSQFSPEPNSAHRTLAEFGFPKNCYSLGRLDATSEGLLLLSDEPNLTDKLLNPKRGHRRTYHVQIEGIPDEAALNLLRAGVVIQGEQTRPCQAYLLAEKPNFPERIPPIRQRLSIPTSWLELTLTEGKNRQVRKMTASIGFPTLRLIRVAIENCTLNNLGILPGEWRELTSDERYLIFLEKDSPNRIQRRLR